MSFANLKKQSRSGSLTDKLIKKVEKLNSGEKSSDDRFWKPEVDKAGNGYAVIRFLPAPEGCELPWAQVWSHAFQGPGGWYIENSLTTLGQKDPVSEYNRTLWNSGRDSDKEIARKQKRKLAHYANIYVVKDPANPENEGKVFLYKFGKKIFDKITEAMQPQFADEEAINPFDFWAGANFKLKIRKVEGYWNYDKSEFDSPSELLDDDDALEKMYNNLNDLNEFSDLKNFKSYEDLKKRLDYVLGHKGTPKFQDQETVEEDAQWERERKGDFSESTSYNAPASSGDFNDSDITPQASTETDEDADDALSYFQKLAES
tara:strand:+ start:1446 stop:2396 length:951 start_codon:yes stop_codon:yes gene_type:complete